MKLDVYLDLGNIAGLVALKATEQLVYDTGVAVRWLPIQGIVPRPLSRQPKANADDPLSEYKHLRWQAKHKFELAELERDCARLALPPELASGVFDSNLTHWVWLGLLEAGLPVTDYIHSVYQQRFLFGVGLETETEVRDHAAAFGVGLDVARLGELWATHQAAYLELGIHDSPAYVLADETFQGRQHLPLIRWRIGGEQGPPTL
jgi:2-hydroxychromene-2-carboxylate isomerase